MLFCEGQYTSQHSIIREPANVLSSVFIFYFGFYGLGITHPMLLIENILYSFLALTGVGSVLYHSSLDNVAFKLCDEIPMILCCTLAFHCIKDLCSYLFHWNKFAKITSSLCIVSYTILTITMDLLYPTSSYFLYLFGFPLWLTVPLLIKLGKINKRILTISSYALLLGLGGTLAWYIDINYCSRLISWLYLHAWWHICIGVCCLQQLELLKYFHLRILGYHCIFEENFFVYYVTVKINNKIKIISLV